MKIILGSIMIYWPMASQLRKNIFLMLNLYFLCLLRKCFWGNDSKLVHLCGILTIFPVCFCTVVSLGQFRQDIRLHGFKIYSNKKFALN